MSKISVLMVEDNSDMRTAVKSYLNDQGYSVTAVETSEEVIDDHLYNEVDIALVDISLPGKSGLDLTSHMKSEGFTGPIIAITARDTVDDKVVGLSSGMNDYIVKPFDLRELDARIKAQLRVAGTYQSMASVATKSFRIEPKRHKFFIGNSHKKLTIVEFRLMLRLMQHNHGIVSTQDLIEFAWGESAQLSSPPIRIHISNLRSKIGDADLRIIQTVPGIGYMLQD